LIGFSKLKQSAVIENRLYAGQNFSETPLSLCLSTLLEGRYKSSANVKPPRGLLYLCMSLIVVCCVHWHGNILFWSKPHLFIWPF